MAIIFSRFTCAAHFSKAPHETIFWRRCLHAKQLYSRLHVNHTVNKPETYTTRGRHRLPGPLFWSFCGKNSHLIQRNEQRFHISVALQSFFVWFFWSFLHCTWWQHLPRNERQEHESRVEAWGLLTENLLTDPVVIKMGINCCLHGKVLLKLWSSTG